MRKVTDTPHVEQVTCLSVLSLSVARRAVVIQPKVN